MVCAPLGVYFGTVNRVFEGAFNSIQSISNTFHFTIQPHPNANTQRLGNSTYAGAYAAVTANLVVLGYILMAIWEDSGAEKSRKGDVVKGKEE
ncbi:uncharacterized protein PADG_04181 [Paracoccidioides brasiliensis Pb18]|uniref:Vacuolar ATPase assembly integral membrane protein VMA21 n=1 Tax=Paracoccidioides brasiliensis (strain Pb18) TaxID=502780 RepID=C1GA95_PARBD|nr:uncharacterized protein PADG_04181 [Paracoccidioides brasiliensis Pb18]EEH48097.2 hypothetical protein PADG_04181 [Paracoccidioides brasiliensis Pb18]